MHIYKLININQYNTIKLETESNQTKEKELYQVERGVFTFDPENEGWKNTVIDTHNRLHKPYVYKDAYRINENSDLEIAVLECEIPIGAKYYKGYSCLSAIESAYVSDELHVIRDINFKF